MRRRPFILSTAVATALLALAASAAYTNPLRAAGTRSGAVPQWLIDFTVTTVVIVAIVALVLSIPMVPFGINRREQRSFPVRVLRTLGILAVIGVLLAIIVRHLHIHHLLHLNPAPPKGQPSSTHGKPAPATHASFLWVEFFVMAGLGLLVVLIVFARRRRRPTGGRPGDLRRESLDEAISESLDDLRIDADLRRAIVAAYARMERALAATGVPREPAEAPHEYLERALLSVDASASAARRLTELFERAKFSHHEPDARMRDDAVDALVAVRDDLRASKAVAA